MTARLDKMEEADLIRRLPDPDDRRGVVIELTDHGRDLWEQSIAVQAEKESTVAAALTEAEQDQLNDAPASARDRVHRRARAALQAPRHLTSPATEYDSAMSSLEQVTQPSVARRSATAPARSSARRWASSRSRAPSPPSAPTSAATSRVAGASSPSSARSPASSGSTSRSSSRSSSRSACSSGSGPSSALPRRRCSPTTPRCSPQALWQAGGTTALFIGGFGAYGYATRHDLSKIARARLLRAARADRVRDRADVRLDSGRQRDLRGARPRDLRRLHDVRLPAAAPRRLRSRQLRCSPPRSSSTSSTSSCCCCRSSAAAGAADAPPARAGAALTP